MKKANELDEEERQTVIQTNVLMVSDHRQGAVSG